MVRIEDVYPAGTAYLVFDGALKARFREGTDHEVFLTPGEIYEFDIDIGNIAISFDTGHRIRVGIASALYDRYEANPNTGEPFREETHNIIAHNNIYVGPSYPSRIVFDKLPEARDEVEYELSAGWNLLSYPFNDDASISDVFPLYIPPAWGFDVELGGYITIDTISTGMGFWVLSPSDTTITASGSEAADTTTITFFPGWNLIGGPIVSVSASEITPYILPPIFGFDAESGEYFIADELLPGLGYWVLALDTVEIRLP